MVDRDLDVLVLQSGEGLTGNFLRIDVPEELPFNEWMRLRVTGIEGGKLSTSSPSCSTI